VNEHIIAPHDVKACTAFESDSITQIDVSTILQEKGIFEG
jgi:hypothetical protein